MVKKYILIFVTAFLGSIITIGIILLFEEIIHLVWGEVLGVDPTAPTRSLAAPISIVITGIVVHLISKRFGQVKGGMDKIIQDLNSHGQINWHEVPKTLLVSLISVSSGAPLGPEAPATEASAGVASWLGEKSKSKLKTKKTLGIASIVGMLAGFVVFTIYTGGFSLPVSNQVDFALLPFAFLYGLITALLGLIVAIAAKALPVKSPIIASIIVAILIFIFPSIMFSGQFLIPNLISFAPTLPVAILIIVALAKIFSTSLLLKTGFFGGPIFPALFAAAAIGLAISNISGHPQPLTVAAALGGLFTLTIRQPIAGAALAVAVTNIYALPAVVLGTLGGLGVQFLAKYLLDNKS